MDTRQVYDVVVVGGGPAGATIAAELAGQGHSVLLIDRAGRIKPCGGAIPPRLVKDYAIPDSIICARINCARIVAPSSRHVDMPIDDGYVAMVDREVFDEFLRRRAGTRGAERMTGRFVRISRDEGAHARVHIRTGSDQSEKVVAARLIIGADGANSAVGRQEIAGAERMRCVFAYHEIVRAPAAGEAGYDARRCDVHYDGRYSPDFYSWVFPHGATASIGTGTHHKGFALRESVAAFRVKTGLDRLETIRREGAPIPLKPLRRWDNGRDVLLVGDAAGVVAPASGEGIYYAMASATFAAEAAAEMLRTGDARALARARKRFMKAHGRVFFILGVMQWFWYRSDRLRERFVSMCADKDVQRLTWESYMHKELVRKSPGAHFRIFLKDAGHLLGLVRP
ncbi:geranylgeranyl diphosphate reductase [Phreatobacter sp.]|uniref:geranylgeranyl diphosphate reductase n=1 Tax=Phreatobacter sp. TaxID=1966341 RepID=UPI003F6F8D7C